MKIHHLLIVILIASIMALATTTFVTDLGSNYARSADFSGLNKTLNASKRMENLSGELRNEVDNFIPDDAGDILFIPYRFLRTAWAGVKLMFGSWSTVEIMTTELITTTSDDVRIPIPSWVISTIVAMLVITLTAIIMYSLFKWKAED